MVMLMELTYIYKMLQNIIDGVETCDCEGAEACADENVGCGTKSPILDRLHVHVENSLEYHHWT